MHVTMLQVYFLPIQVQPVQRGDKPMSYYRFKHQQSMLKIWVYIFCD